MAQNGACIPGGSVRRLRAEMRLPGEAWLEWRVVPDDESSSTAGATLHQRALFHPRGLWGRAYWYAVLPFHALIFGRLCDALAEAATANPSSSPSPSRAISRR